MFIRCLVVISLCFLVFNTKAQEYVGEFSKIRPDTVFENIHIHEVSSDINSTTFAIWIKKKVRTHKHINHVENIYITQGEGKFHLGMTSYHVEEGDLIVVPKNTWHSLEVTSSLPVKIISIQSPQFIGEDIIFKQ